MTVPTLHRRMLLAVLLCAAALSGCAGYRFGAQSLYPQHIRSVHVPVFRNESFRRGMGERLTEAVIKEIELKSTMKVVAAGRADSVLQGRIVAINKRVIAEDVNDVPRNIEMNFLVEASWFDRQGALIGQEICLDVPPALLRVGASSEFIPEAGQSGATAQQEAIEKVAQQIVQRMEVGF